MNYDSIKAIADRVVAQLQPYCERIEIAGSIRRKKTFPNDIEIVYIPKKAMVKQTVNDLFGETIIKEELLPMQQLIDIINSWKKVKGEPTGKYTQRILPEGIKVDLFTATKQSWGLTLAVRTGSAEFSHNVLANAWCRAGYKSEKGILMKEGKEIPIYEEKDLFRMLQLAYVEPEDRVLATSTIAMI